MILVYVVLVLQIVVVILLEVVIGFGQLIEMVVVMFLDGVVIFVVRRMYEGFIIVIVLMQGGSFGIVIGEQEKIYGGEDEEECYSNEYYIIEDIGILCLCYIQFELEKIIDFVVIYSKGYN